MSDRLISCNEMIEWLETFSQIVKTVGDNEAVEAVIRYVKHLKVSPDHPYTIAAATADMAERRAEIDRIRQIRR